MALDATRGEGEGTLSAPEGGGALVKPRGSRGLRDPAQVEVASGPLGQTPACLRTDLCCQGESVSPEMWDPAPHHPQSGDLPTLGGGCDGGPLPGPGHLPGFLRVMGDPQTTLAHISAL